MRFEKGNTYGQGRPKGAGNKVSEQARETLATAISGELEKISEHLGKITDPRERIDAIAKLLPYVMPKLTNVDMTVEDVSEGIKYFDFTSLPQEALEQIFQILHNVKSTEKL